MVKRKRKVIMLGTISISIAVMVCVYFILMFTGVINSNVNTLEITSSSDSIEYNGEELSSHDYEITKGSLHKGHTIDVKFLKSITNVGQIANEVSVSILDSNNYDVTDEYDLKINTGLLTVLKREITISTSSASKAYDGKELSSSDWYVTKGNVVKKHTINVKVLGSITEVGQTPNICEASICNEQGQDVTTNYGITFDYGTLTIERKSIKFFSENIKKTFDGKTYTPDTSKDFSFEGRLLNSTHTIVYDANPTITSVGTQTYTFNATIYNEYGDDVTSDYEVSYEYGQIEIVSQKLSLRTGSINKTYDGKEVLCEEYQITNNIKLIDNYEIVCKDFIPRTNSGSYDNTCIFEVLFKGEKTLNYVIDEESLQYGLIVINPVEITISCKNDIKEYDDEYSIIPDLIYNESILINGDYITYEKNDFNYKNVGSYSLSKSDYLNFDILNLNNESNIKNYDVKYELGKIVINKKKIIVDLGIEDRSYDGNSYGWEEIDYSIANLDEEKFNINFVFDNVSSITNVGSLDLTPLSVSIYRNENASNDLSSNFDIAYNNYMLNIKPRPIVVSTLSATKYYDGTSLTCEDDPNGCWIKSGTLLDSHTGDHNRCITELKEVSKNKNEVNYTIKDKITGEDVTENYKIEYDYGYLEIKVINLKIYLYDGSKTYNNKDYYQQGEAINSKNYSKTVSESNSSHDIRLIYIGQPNKEVGTYTVTEDDIYLQVIEDKNGEEIDITSAYNFEFYGADVVINRRGISIATGSVTAPLTEEALQYPYYTKSGTLLEGHTLKGEFVSLEGVGTIENKAIFVVEDEDGNDVTLNYIFYYSYGTLTVESTPGADDKYGYVIAPQFLSYEYDGITTVQDYVDRYNEGLANGTERLSGVDQLVDEHKLTYEATVKVKGNGSSTEVGKYTLEIESFKLYSKGIDVTRQYKLSYQTNTLQIYRYVLNVSTNSINVDTYDGRILDSELNHSGLQAGHYIYIESVPFINNVGSESDNEIKFIIKDGQGTYANDVTDQYLLNVTYGKLNINQAKSITLDLSEFFVDHDEDESNTYTLNDLISYVDDLCSKDTFGTLELIYKAEDAPNPAEYILNYKIYKTIDGVKYDVTNLYSIDIIYPED